MEGFPAVKDFHADQILVELRAGSFQSLVHDKPEEPAHALGAGKSLTAENLIELLADGLDGKVWPDLGISPAGLSSLQDWNNAFCCAHLPFHSFARLIYHSL
jgi:hypothetical protein